MGSLYALGSIDILLFPKPLMLLLWFMFSLKCPYHKIYIIKRQSIPGWAAFNINFWFITRSLYLLDHLIYLWLPKNTIRVLDTIYWVLVKIWLHVGYISLWRLSLSRFVISIICHLQFQINYQYFLLILTSTVHIWTHKRG